MPVVSAPAAHVARLSRNQESGLLRPGYDGFRKTSSGACRPAAVKPAHARGARVSLRPPDMLRGSSKLKDATSAASTAAPPHDANPESGEPTPPPRRPFFSKAPHPPANAVAAARHAASGRPPPASPTTAPPAGRHSCLAASTAAAGAPAGSPAHQHGSSQQAAAAARRRAPPDGTSCGTAVSGSRRAGGGPPSRPRAPEPRPFRYVPLTVHHRHHSCSSSSSGGSSNHSRNTAPRRVTELENGGFQPYAAPAEPLPAAAEAVDGGAPEGRREDERTERRAVVARVGDGARWWCAGAG